MGFLYDTCTVSIEMKGRIAMFNFFAFIAWPILIGGVIGAYKFGKKHWGIYGTVLLPIAFVVLFFLLFFLWLGETWWVVFLPVLPSVGYKLSTGECFLCSLIRSSSTIWA